MRCEMSLALEPATPPLEAIRTGAAFDEGHGVSRLADETIGPWSATPASGHSLQIVGRRKSLHVCNAPKATVWPSERRSSRWARTASSEAHWYSFLMSPALPTMEQLSIEMCLKGPQAARQREPWFCGTPPSGSTRA